MILLESMYHLDRQTAQPFLRRHLRGFKLRLGATLLLGLFVSCSSKNKSAEPYETTVDGLVGLMSRLQLETNLKATIDASIKAPSSTTLCIQGVIWQRRAYLLVGSLQATGGRRTIVIRAGHQIWTYHAAAEEWVTPEDVADPSLGRGIANPHEFLCLLSSSLLQYRPKVNAVRASAAAAVSVEVALDPTQYRSLVGLHWPEVKADWARSKLLARFEIDSQGWIERAAIEATLVPLQNPSGDFSLLRVKVEIERHAPWSVDEVVAAYARETRQTVAVTPEISKSIRDFDHE